MENEKKTYSWVDQIKISENLEITVPKEITDILFIDSLFYYNISLFFKLKKRTDNEPFCNLLHRIEYEFDEEMAANQVLFLSRIKSLITESSFFPYSDIPDVSYEFKDKNCHFQTIISVNFIRIINPEDIKILIKNMISVDRLLFYETH